ncbi:EF-Hand 1, calcium-binding site [Phytophthora cactorum]|nr:EF-Hand 1, calcium-binding site [Phytophthora cactorum]
MAATKRALGRNIMVFASEVPVISALNPYRKIEDVFLDVWRRTNPRQVSSLQKHLSLALPSHRTGFRRRSGHQRADPRGLEAKTIHQVAIAQAKVVQSLPSTTPADVKADVVQFVTSTMHKGFGVKQETAGIEQYQEKEKCGGKIDGRADGKVIEVKNRLKRFMNPLPKYDIAQLQTYLYILDVQEGELVEHLHADKAQTKMTKVPWDDKMWNAEIEPYLVQFGSALTYLMKDKTAQKDYLQSDAGQQREIIRYLWSQEVQTTFACYDEDGSGWIDAAELRHLVSDLGGVLTERDFHKALRLLDRDSNGVIDRDEFTQWWVGQSEGNEAVGEVEKALARLKDFGRQRFRVDIHTACWNGFEDVVERLVEDGSELVNERDSSEYGVSWGFL